MPRDLASDPAQDGVRVPRRSSRRPRTGTAGTTWSAPSSRTWSTATADEVLELGLRGLERGQPRGVLVRHRGRVDAALRRHRGGREGRRRAARASADRPRPRPAGSTTLLAHAAPHRVRRSTSSPRTPTAARRWTSARRWSGYGRRRPRSCGPSGASPRRTSTRSTTASSPATFLLRGHASSAGRLDALSYWVASDHFEELGRPPRLLHGGFGLITVGGIAKPRYHALCCSRSARRAARHRNRRRRRRTGADLGVPPRRRRLAVLVWCRRSTRPSATAIPPGPHASACGCRRRRRATPRSSGWTRDHGDVTTLAQRLGVADWPTDEQWDELRGADTLVAEPAALRQTAGAAQARGSTLPSRPRCWCACRRGGEPPPGSAAQLSGSPGGNSRLAPSDHARAMPARRGPSTRTTSLGRRRPSSAGRSPQRSSRMRQPGRRRRSGPGFRGPTLSTHFFRGGVADPRPGVGRTARRRRSAGGAATRLRSA